MCEAVSDNNFSMSVCCATPHSPETTIVSILGGSGNFSCVSPSLANSSRQQATVNQVAF